jgi:hypothetical protein
MKSWHKLIIILSAIATVIFIGYSLLDEPQLSGLQVITGEAKSSLFLDGQYLDKTPFIDKTIKPGQYTLKIEPENQDLAPYETQVSLRSGLLTVVTWKPGPNPETSGGVIYEMEKINGRKGELSFITIPDNTIIYFDQNQQQFAPLALKDIEPGHHQFEISLPSYEKQQHTINVVAGHRVTVTAKLARSLPPSDNHELPTKQQSLDTATDATQSSVISDSSGEETATTSSQLTGAKGTVTINSTGFFQDGEEVLKVRKEASAGAEIAGYASVGESYPYLSENQSGWLKITFQDQAGWVSANYATQN